MPAKKPITAGTRFGRLTAISELRGNHGYQWLCRCDCGRETVSYLAKLRSGHTQSCGCLGLEHAKRMNRTHGMRHTPEYNSWVMMRNRCSNPTDKSFPRYGGRGIKVCDRWKQSFESFFEDMGSRPSGMSIDRIDVNGNYEPSNCRWATAHEQARNMRRNVFIEHMGERKVLGDWCREYGVPFPRVRARLIRGMSIGAALTTPRMHRWDHLRNQRS